MLGTDRLTLIESVFLARLIESRLYGDPKDGLASELADKAPADLTARGLEIAANAIIRKRNNGAFPALPACLEEIERHCAPRPATPGGGRVTAATWEQSAVAFVRMAGYAKDKIPVITRTDHPERWDAWQQFFADIGMMASASMMTTAERWTVVAMWPQDLDPGYVPSRSIASPSLERTAA